MTLEGLLTGLVFALVPVTWLSTGILAVFAVQRPRIGALTERAVIALMISLLITSGAVLALNTVLGRALFDADMARIVFRVSLLGIGLVPAAWLVLFVTNRLGE